MGRPKCWLPFGGERLLARVVRRVAEAAEPVIVVAAPGQEVPEAPAAWAVVRDAVADQGPLQGLATGLRALPESTELVFAAATDMAMLQPAWIERLVDLIGDGDLAIPQVDGFFQPLAAVYRRSTILPIIDRLLAGDRPRPVSLVESARARIVSEAELREVDPDLRSLGNLNTPDEYRKALVLAGLDPESGRKPIPVVVELLGIPGPEPGTDRLELLASTVGEALIKLALACPSLAGKAIVGDRPGPGYRLILNDRQVISDPEVPLMVGERLVLMAV